MRHDYVEALLLYVFICTCMCVNLDVYRWVLGSRVNWVVTHLHEKKKKSQRLSTNYHVYEFFFFFFFLFSCHGDGGRKGASLTRLSGVNLIQIKTNRMHKNHKVRYEPGWFDSMYFCTTKSSTILNSCRIVQLKNGRSWLNSSQLYLASKTTYLACKMILSIF